MGLDGISVNQLRVTPEHNSAELNNNAKAAQNFTKIVDGLSSGQRVDPDRQKEKDKNDFEFEKKQNEEEEESTSEQEAQQDVIKYDLSKSDKYILKIDEKTDNILIVEKATKNVVQTIEPKELSLFVSFLSNSQGSIVNRKF